MSGYEFAWLMYALGAFGCALAAWLLFGRLGREWGHFFFITVLVLLLTPYAIDAESMTMAPALFVIVIDGISDGMEQVKPVVMVLLGVWLVGLVLSLIFQLVVRRFEQREEQVHYQPMPPVAEYDEDDEDFSVKESTGEAPIRALR